jgi:predicted TIM-barrel fold metal-dependent hydrolase
VALLALQDREAAIREVEWARENGFRAVVMDRVFPVKDHPFGTPLGIHTELWPLFERIEQADLPIYLHAVQHGHRMVNLPAYQMFGLDIFVPDDGQMTMASLITSGLLDRYPRLRFIDAEKGVGYILPLISRMDRAWRKATETVWDEEFDRGRRVLNPRAPQVVPPDLRDEKNQHPPRHYFEANFFWTIETEESALADAVSDLGADRFLFATDYPHDDPGGTMKWKDAELLAANERIPEGDKERIRWQNAVELFRL